MVPAETPEASARRDERPVEYFIFEVVQAAHGPQREHLYTCCTYQCRVYHHMKSRFRRTRSLPAMVAG